MVRLDRGNGGEGPGRRMTVAVANTVSEEGAAVALRVHLARSYPPVLAFGAFLKNTVCVIDGDTAYLSHAASDLDSPEAIAEFEKRASSLLAEIGAEPVLIAHDLHPDFYSSRHAATFGVPTLPVQHHHAHIAALMAEHRLTGPVIGLALDGFGLGPANESWGGELLWVDGAECRRLGHLKRLAQPGGDVAAREPWRMGAAALHSLGRGGEIAERFADHKAATMLAQIMSKGLNSPETSSCGRLFDAACGLLGVRTIAEFEGQAPMELEGLVQDPKALDSGWTLDDAGVLGFDPLLARLADCEAQEGADLFHGTLAAALVQWARWASEETGAERVALGGGCFLNKVLCRLMADGLADGGLDAYFPESLSPGDPAVSVGQALIAAEIAAETAANKRNS